MPVDIASLVVFRIAFGAIMLWEVWRHFAFGWIGPTYIEPTFHFTYFGFDWVHPWPGGWMYLHFWILGVLAACIMVGAHVPGRDGPVLPRDQLHRSCWTRRRT